MGFSRQEYWSRLPFPPLGDLLWDPMSQKAPLSMEFCRQEYWSGLLFPPPGDLPNQGIKPESPMSPALQVVLFMIKMNYVLRPLLNNNLYVYRLVFL